MPASDLQSEPAQSIASALAHRVSRLLRVLLLVTCFCLGLFGGSVLIERQLQLPMLPVPLVKEKIEWLAQHGDQYDTLFIGTSRTLEHIQPALFDQLMAQAGMPTHSFNLGILGMRPPEDSYLLETVLAKRRAPLKLVIVEANTINAENEADALGTLREVYWRDTSRFWVVTRSILERKRKTLWKTEVLVHNLNVYLRKTLSVGRGIEWLTGHLEKNASPPPQSLGKYSDGYLSYDTPLRTIKDEEWRVFQTKFKRNIQLVFNDGASQQELAKKRLWVEAHGGKMIAFTPPIAGINHFIPDPRLHPGLPWLNFFQPAKYPEFFQKENLADSGHLNQQGAEFFTRRLVEEIVALEHKKN